MSNCLVLLTNYYPYYKGEEYLESEISYLAESYTDIIIIPTMVNNNMQQTREIPNNVKLVNIDYRHTTLNKIKNTLITKKNSIDNSQPSVKGIKVKLYQNYFKNRSREILELIEKKIGKISFDKYQKVDIYSYWLYITAHVSIGLKELIIKENKNVKTFSRAHRYDLYENEAPLSFLPCREYILKNIDYVYPCSEDGTVYLQNKYPDFASKISTQRLGTKYIGTNHNENDGIFRIVSCSAIRKVKRIDLIIESLNILEKKEIAFHWTHIGDGDLFEETKQKAKENLLESNYTFLGFMKNEELMSYYQNHSIDCFVNVSESEGIPVSIMEAMSFSIPVIGTNVGGTSEIVFSNQNGLLVDKNVTDIELSNALIELAKLSANDLDTIRKNAYNTWENNYSSEKNYSKFSKMISSL